VVRQGHALTLYCYSKPEDVPEGVTTADAAEIVPADQVIAYHGGGSHSLFSNRFRYELQRRGAGTWVDCDVYLLQPLDGTRPYLCGEQAPGEIAIGVLRVPPDSKLLPPLLALFDERVVPWWLPWRARMAAYLRLAMAGRSGSAAMPWGTSGPAGFTAVSKALGIDPQPLAPEMLYPVPWQQAEWIIDPDSSLDAKISPRTVAIHLWNERIKHLNPEQAPSGSFLARLCEEGR
jgi:hypothetical protein